MKSVKIFGLTAALVAMFAFALPAAAQDATVVPPTGTVPAALPGTITVYGSASVEGAPDQATLELGVDISSNSVIEAFASSNDIVRAIVAAIVEMGVAEEDIQTSNLSVYSTNSFNSGSGNETGYQVTNTVSIVVNNIDLVDQIINVSIEKGATTLYGLYFSVSNRVPLETLARQGAVAQAQARAAELASLVGAQVGEIISISEDASVGTPIFFDSANMQNGGGNAFIAPGETSVTVGVTVTFALVR